MKKILVDSATWKAYFEIGNDSYSDVLETLIKEDNALIIGYTITKVLSEIHTDNKELFEKILNGFLTLSYIEIEKEHWIEASKLLFEFKNLPFELALLCVLSRKKNLEILTRNKEVKKIKGVKVYEPHIRR